MTDASDIAASQYACEAPLRSLLKNVQLDSLLAAPKCFHPKEKLFLFSTLIF